MLCLVIVAACGDRGEEPKQPVPAVTGKPSLDEAAEEAPLPRYTLTYAADANGSITGELSQSVPQGGHGSPVTAVAGEGYHFTGWSDGVASASRTDRDVASDLSATAAFARNRYTLRYLAEKNGAIDGAAIQEVPHGEDGKAVTAVADRGFHFTAWSDGVTTARRTDTGVVGDRTVRAAFAVDTYRIGGVLSGLAPGAQLVLRNNEGDDLVVTGNGAFTFPTLLASGSPYAVQVLREPASPKQVCTVTSGSGNVADADVAGVRVECRIVTYAIGGTVSGLPEGGQVVLRNGGEDLAVSANGKFVFLKGLPDGGKYEVKVRSLRLKPKWTCEVQNGAGTLAGADVTGVEVNCFTEVELQAQAGNRRIELLWNSKDFAGASFSLCRAQEEIPAKGVGRCADLAGGVLKSGADSPQVLARLSNEVTYWFQVEVRHANGKRTYSRSVAATPLGSLNDTGIDWCADNTTNRRLGGTRTDRAAGCEELAASHPGQDARYGRDAAAAARGLKKTGSGQAGFDYSKVCMSGELAGEGKCPPNPTLGSGPNNWACTLDNVTGLIWEVKTESGPRGRNHTYTWYNPVAATNGGDAGRQNGGSCPGGNCDTQGYVKAVNAQGLCGGTNWRLPTRKELLSIVDNGRLKPAVDPGFFPNSPAGYYWTTTPYADQKYSAWQVYFLYGEANTGEKNQPAQVRLVRPAE